MAKRDELTREIGERLRITAREIGLPSQASLADYLGANRPQVDAWLNGRAKPPVEYMIKLADRGISLDWIYKGDPMALTLGLYIRVKGAMTAEIAKEAPPFVPPAPGAVCQQELTHYRKKPGSPSIKRQKKGKQATAS